MDEEYCSYSSLEETAKFLKEKTSPKVGIICGSGLGSLAELIENPKSFNYSDIPNFPVSQVHGHENCLVFGYLEKVPVVAMKGRCHFFEGHSLPKCCFPIRVLHLLGITHLIVTNAAGALNEKFQVGDIMIIRDHINLLGIAGTSPLIGLTDARFGTRFLPMVNAYDAELIERAKQIVARSGHANTVREGVYCCVAGPSYETVAEARLLRDQGADAVGMSTVHEVITARQCGLNVFGFSLITNMVVLEYGLEEEPNHEAIVKVGKDCEEKCNYLVREMIKSLATAE